MAAWLELEEQVGRLWHRMVGGAASYPAHPQAAVALAEVRPMLAVLFRALGGAAAVELAAAGAQDSRHRLTLRQRLGMDSEAVPRTSLGPAVLRLPESLSLFAAREANRDLYLWLAAFCAVAATQPPPLPDPDPLRADLRALRAAHLTARAALLAFPGLRRRYDTLCDQMRAIRPVRPLAGVEAAVEQVVLALLSSAPPPRSATGMWEAVTGPDPDVPDAFAAPSGYRPFLPVPLWGEVAPHPADAAPRDSAEAPGPAADREQDSRKRRARRRRFDQTDRTDPLILNRFEKILSLADMVNVNRGKDDDDDDQARKAADDLEEIALGRTAQKTASRLRLDLDLPPDAVVGGALDGSCTYPEWDYRRQVMLPAHCRVVTGPVTPPDGDGPDWQPGEETRRLIRQVRRQFEALRPRRQTLRRQADGDELDLEAVVRDRVDRLADGTSSDRLYQLTRPAMRDLSVAVLVDVSLSTDAWIDNRRVLDVEKEALSVLLSGINACGDENAVFTFTSRRRDFVRVQTVKDFDEGFGPAILRRVAALTPGYYTRIGAAVRHVTTLLDQRPHRHRLLLLLTDGKPNDVDHYEGRFGIEDTRKAILEARRKGLSVFGVTIDHRAQDYFPALFGRGHYAIVGEIARLSRALPRLYQALVR